MASPGDSIKDDIQLFKSISKGDEEAFTEIFHRYTPRLFPFILKLTRDDQAARELIQETFFRIWLQRDQLQQVQQPSAWIYRIASNISVNYLKTIARRKKLLKNVAQAESERPHSRLDTKELDLILKRAIDFLPERRQIIYRLSREEGLSHQEIADKLDISVQTVKNQIGMALKSLQEYISGQMGLSVVTVAILLLL